MGLYINTPILSTKEFDMDFINEVLDQDDVTSLLAEMDAVLEQYKALTMFTRLNEGVLDNLSDDLIQKVSEIQRRIEVISKARGIVAKLQKSGGFSKEEVAQHRERLRKNRKALSAALSRASQRMQQFEKTAKQEIEKSGSAAKDDNENPQSDVDLRAFGKLAPFLLRKAAEGSLDVNELDYDKYGETIALLQSEDLIDQQGSITDKGEAAWKSYSAKKNAPKQKPNRDAMDDLADMGSQSDTQSDLADFG